MTTSIKDMSTKEIRQTAYEVLGILGTPHTGKPMPVGEARQLLARYGLITAKGMFNQEEMDRIAEDFGQNTSPKASVAPEKPVEVEAGPTAEQEPKKAPKAEKKPRKAKKKREGLTDRQEKLMGLILHYEKEYEGETLFTADLVDLAQQDLGFNVMATGGVISTLREGGYVDIEVQTRTKKILTVTDKGRQIMKLKQKQN